MWREGTALYAVGSDADAARFIGIKVVRTTFLTYMLAGAAYGLAGVMVTAQTSTGDPLVGEPLLLQIFAAVVENLRTDRDLDNAILAAGAAAVAAHAALAVLGFEMLLVTEIDKGIQVVGRDEAAAGPPRHERTAVETIVRPEGRDQLARVELRHMALDDDEQVRGFDPGLENRFAFAEVRDVDGVSNEPLLVGIEPIER